MRVKQMVKMVMLFLALSYGSMTYGDCYWSAQSGDITDPATWGGIAPEDMDSANDGLVIANDHTVNVVGNTTVRVVYDGYWTGEGTSGTYSDSQGFAVMDDPNAVLTTNFLFVGFQDRCNGRFTQNAGSVQVVYSATDGGNFMISVVPGTNGYSEYEGQTSWGEYVLNGGDLYVEGGAYLGAGKATFIQTGGTFTTPLLRIGDGNYASLNETSDVNYYNMTGGVLNATGGLWLAIQENARAVFNLGDANSTGTIQGAGNLYVKMGNRDWSQGRGEAVFQGWGQVNMTGTLANAGKVIADSKSNAEVQADRDLDMSSFSSVANLYYDRLADAGWYAVNRGRLILPSINVGSGTSTVGWGDDPSIAYPALVNSVKMDFVDVVGGTVSGSLLAKDRSDVGLANQDVIGVWSFVDSAFDFGNGSVGLTIRYDDAMAAALGLVEDDLKFYDFVGGSWEEVACSIDSAGNLLTVSDLSSFSMFAIGSIVLNQLPGDANGDGMVDVGDLGILAGNYGTLTGATWAMGDFNNDGAVDVGDLGILAGNYGAGTAPAASVPEPMSLGLLTLGGLALIRRRS